MTPDLLRQIEELYHSVRAASAEEGVFLLAQADPELRTEVESLLAHQDDSLPAFDVLLVTSTQSGERLGPYQIENTLGEGGMSEGRLSSAKANLPMPAPIFIPSAWSFTKC